MASSTDQVNTAQLKELEFELAWKTRDEIIANLSEHTKLLSGMAVELDARETTRNANGDLIVVLLNLPVKADGRSKSCQSLGQSSEVVFELHSDVRSRIVDTLMTNYNVAAQKTDSFSSEFKSKLIEKNNDLICELVKLKSRTIAVPSVSYTSNGNHLIEQTAKASGSQAISKTPTRSSTRLKKAKSYVDETFQPVEQSVAIQQSVTGQSASCPTVGEVRGILKEELQKITEELSKQISNQSSVIGSLKKNVRGLKRKLEESKAVENEPAAIPSKSGEVVDETTVTLELKDIEAVLAGSKNSTFSPNFSCGGIPWLFGARLNVASGKKHLMIFLFYDKKIDRGRWRVVTTFEIRLLSSNSGAVCDVIRIEKDREFKNSSDSPNFAWGCPEFITVDQLRSGSFIKEDAINLQVHLTINSFERLTD